MPLLLRKTLIALIAAALVAAGGFVPKHAHAKGTGGHHAAGAHSHGVGGGHQHATAVQSDEQRAASLDCDKDTAPAEQGGTPIVNCCVASCAAIAHIFAAIDLPNAPQSESFVAATLDRLVLAARTSDDPPPR